jgi:hypothetical protein
VNEREEGRGGGIYNGQIRGMERQYGREEEKR